MKNAFTLMLALGAACLALPAQAEDAGDAKAAQTAVNLCSTCHGPRGVSVSPEFPILAAQQEPYLAAQIQAFRAHTRSEKDAHDFMWGIAGQLSPDVVEGLARYYSSQPPSPGRPGDAAMTDRGKALYDRGAAERGIPACASCHGSQGAGMAMFPRLAGQHAKYVVKQLNYIQTLVRAAPVMHGIIKDLAPAEIEAVAAYVQSL
jgi:cytochrome c553